MNPTKNPRKKAEGGLVIAKRHFVTGVTIPFPACVGLTLASVGAGAREVTMLSALLAVCPTPSVTLTVKFAVPVAVGAPLSAPVALFRVTPAGSAPEITLQEYGAVPPVAVKEAA